MICKWLSIAYSKVPLRMFNGIMLKRRMSSLPPFLEKEETKKKQIGTTLSLASCPGQQFFHFFSTTNETNYSKKRLLFVGKSVENLLSIVNGQRSLRWSSRRRRRVPLHTKLEE